MWRRNCIALACLLGLTVGAYVILFWVVGLADFFVLHPTTHSIPMRFGSPITIPLAKGTTRETLEVWVGRTQIRATDEDEAFVLDLSPNAGRAEWGLAYGINKWEGWPVEYWALNYPGYGKSQGACTLENVHRSALAAYDALAERAKGKPIFVSGYSLGTAAALHVAANRKVAGLYLYNPPPLRQLIVGKFGWWNLWLGAYPVARGVPAELDSLQNGSRSKVPAVFVLGERDTFVDYPYQQRVAEAYAGEKRLLPLPVNHNDDPELNFGAEVRGAVGWLWERGVGGVPGRGSRSSTRETVRLNMEIGEGAAETGRATTTPVLAP